MNLDQKWVLDPQVAVRPEPFGALVYHFGTRKLSFLKDRRLLDVVSSLNDFPTLREACTAAGIRDVELPTFTAALDALATSRMLKGVTS